MALLELVLVIAAAILAIVALVEARGRAWVAWSALCLAVALLLARVG